MVNALLQELGLRGGIAATEIQRPMVPQICQVLHVRPERTNIVVQRCIFLFESHCESFELTVMDRGDMGADMSERMGKMLNALDWRISLHFIFFYEDPGCK